MDIVQKKEHNFLRLLPYGLRIQQQCKFVPQRMFETNIWSPLIWTPTDIFISDRLDRLFRMFVGGSKQGAADYDEEARKLWARLDATPGSR